MSSFRVLDSEKITFRYMREAVLGEVSFGLGAGATVLPGRNCVAKSTLIATLVGAAQPAGGQMRLGDRVVDGGSRQGRTILRDIGWLPQTFGFPQHMTVKKFVGYVG